MAERPTPDARGMDLEALALAMREAGRPMHVNVLARTAVRAWLQGEASERGYAPGERYDANEVVRLEGESSTVESVTEGSNREQGCFKIVTFLLPDGTKRRMAAEVPGGSVAGHREVTEEQVGQVLSQDGLAVRNTLQEALHEDDRFVWFQDAQGDQWCLAEMLSEVNDDDVEGVWPLLEGLLDDGAIRPRTTEELVKALWTTQNDGSEDYLLKAFSLDTTLERYRETRRVGQGWVTTAEWKKLQERPTLVGPRQQNVVPLPDGIKQDAEDDVAERERDEEEPEHPDEITEEDLESWRERRRLNATITLRPAHYYGNWLPLTQDMQRLFPPRACGADEATFYHRFGSEEGSFQCWVDWDQQRILGSPEMYEAFYGYGIYPGAKLIISHRGNLQEYDIRTEPTTEEGTVLVRRISRVTDQAGRPILDEEGRPKIEYEETAEPRRYEVSDEVFVVAASWEDLPALFEEAEQVGQGYFGLIWKVCCEWWENGGRKPLYVAASELFEEIHYNRRLITSEATIPWELWRHPAFKPVGDGKYLFIPEKGDRVRTIRPLFRSQQPASVPGRDRVEKNRLLGATTRQPGSRPEVEDLWGEVSGDAERMARLRRATLAHHEDPAREKVLFLRRLAHQRIRRLLAPDRLETLTLDEFNEQVWQVGSLRYRGEEHRIDSPDALAALEGMTVEELETALESRELVLRGNQTWGSASSVIGPSLGLSTGEKEQLVRHTVRYLLYGDGSGQDRMAKVIDQSNGFGINVVSGILHAVFPGEHVLYNRRSVDAISAIGVSWPSNWRKNVKTYDTYLRFCKRLEEEFGFESLTDVDWFHYQLGVGERGVVGAAGEVTSRALAELYTLGLAVVRGDVGAEHLTIELLDPLLVQEGLDEVTERVRVAFPNAEARRSGDAAARFAIPLRDTTVHTDAFAEYLDSDVKAVVPASVFALSKEEQVEFARGVVDACVYVHKRAYYFDKRHFLYFQLRDGDWHLPTSLCRLLQDCLNIPVAFIRWGHPILHDPRGKEVGERAVVRPHELKIFADAFAGVGFRVAVKQQHFLKLVNENLEIGREPQFCNPGSKRVTKRKARHPMAGCVTLPAEIRGEHFDVWWQICLKLGCPRASQRGNQYEFDLP